ncbi:unnamed protein product [Oreochromis niloticus]|nr:unnamed protein product [Mustela putorius furo]
MNMFLNCKQLGLISDSVSTSLVLSEAMLRRSERLQSVGCYSREGEPIISYKETLYRRRLRPRPGPDTADHDDVDSDYTIVSDSSRGLFGATKALGLLVLMLVLCFGLIFGIGGPKMDFSTPFMSKYLMSEHEQVERQSTADIQDTRPQSRCHPLRHAACVEQLGQPQVFLSVQLRSSWKADITSFP